MFYAASHTLRYCKQRDTEDRKIKRKTPIGDGNFSVPYSLVNVFAQDKKKDPDRGRKFFYHLSFYFLLTKIKRKTPIGDGNYNIDFYTISHFEDKKKDPDRGRKL